MSIEVWPPVAPHELALKIEETQQRELDWIIQETLEVCRDLKHGLEDCYALLAPIDPGSTLVMSTPRNEKVKGTITRVGTRIVKGHLHLQLRTVPAQTLALSHSETIHIHGLDALHTHLTQAIDVLGITLAKTWKRHYDKDKRDNNGDGDGDEDVRDLASTLALLADSLTRSTALLKGPPLAESDPGWRFSSCPARHFTPALAPNLSFYLGLQESCVVLWLRVVEPADVPVHFGTKLGLAIGTVRRLEHDEMDLVFRYNPRGSDVASSRRGSPRRSLDSRSGPPVDDEMQEVYVREKVRVETADPSLISLYSKLGYLSHMLGQARLNLAAVLGVDVE